MVLVALLGVGAGWSLVDSASAQDEIRNYRKPILTVETGGHHARVRSLVWQDDATLLSGGEDKVVKVWNIGEGGRLARSIRPPIWRGSDGTIYAMAMSRPDAKGQSFLAVGGFGVEVRRGDLTIFRIPGAQRVPTGEVVAHLLPPRGPGEVGHRNSVLCLAFDPDGRVLASGGHDSPDVHQSVILWVRDGEGFRPWKALGERERIGEVRALAFTRDGRRLATGGLGGLLRLWDFNQGTQVGVGVTPDRTHINALALSPDGQFAVVGHEGGGLFRFDLANLGRVGPASLGTDPGQGPVESVAYSPDGRLLAVAIKSDRAATIDPMTMACDMEIRAMPAGNILQRWKVAGLIYASAFNPRGDRLAYSAGPAQSIYLQDTNDLQKPPEELRGKGSTPFDLGFKRDSQVVGFTRVPFDPSRPPPSYEAFDFGQRKSRNVRREDLTFGLRTYNGWSLRGSLNPYVLELVGPDGRRTPLDLDRGTERYWWSWTFLPTGPDHLRPTVAIGCESGVVIYDLATGQRTRVFAGHSSPVVSLVPSPDGRWLASGSLDQTIMLYRLAGCDRRPGLGALFRQRPDGFHEVAAVEPGSFAAAMGLVPGDTIIGASVQSSGAQAIPYNHQEIAQFVARIDQLAPHRDTIFIGVSRMVLLPPPIGILQVPVWMLSTKRDNPALTLMLGADKEWIVWTPQGFYDTSIEGDSKYLGWHINADYRSGRSTDFFPIGTYAGTMFRKEVLDRIWRPEEVAQVALPKVEVYNDQPPRILFTPVGGGPLPEPGVTWRVDVPNPKLGLSISAEGPTTVARRQVTFDERLLALPPLAAPAPRVAEEIQVELFPNRRVRLAVEAANQNGKERKETIDLVYKPPATVEPPPPPRPGLIVIGIGKEKSRDPGPLPGILYADRDARDVAEFLSDHLVSADGARGRQDPPRDRIVLTGEKAFANSVKETLDRLEQRLQAKDIQPGSIVAVMINSHVLDFDTGARIATPDTKQGAEPIPGPMVPARDVSDLLGRLGEYGCRVMVFLDGVHELPDPKLKSDINPWVRELVGERRVITFVASKEGPSQPYREHGVFAQGILDVFRAAGAMAARKDRAAAVTLEEFLEALHQGVQDYSGRMQEAGAYFPEEIEPWTTFAKP